MDLAALNDQLDRQLTQIRDDLVTVQRRVYDHDLPVVVGLLMTLHGWALPNDQPWHADLLTLTRGNFLLDAVKNLREVLSLFEDSAAAAQAILQAIQDQKPPAPADEASAE